MRVALVVGLFVVLAAATVRYVLSRHGPEQGNHQDDGIQEIDP
jgi:hypothetical protein